MRHQPAGLVVRDRLARVLPSRAVEVLASQVLVQRVLSLLQPARIVRAQLRVVMTGSLAVLQHTSLSLALLNPRVVADSNKKSCFAGQQFAVNDWQHKTFC